MSTPLISCIIPTFNRADLLKDAIDSTVNQTFTNWELIVVDGGSVVIKYIVIVIGIFYPVYLLTNKYFSSDAIIIMIQSILSLLIYYGITGVIKFQGFKEFQRTLYEVILPKLKQNK